MKIILILPAILTSLLVLVASLGNAQSAKQAPKAAEVEQLQLIVNAPPDILISRLNPPLLELSNPFANGAVLNANVSGELWQAKPKFYYTKLRPVTWQLSVPAGTKSGTYQAPLKASFSLCSRSRGFCFTTQQNAVFTLQVGSQKKNDPVVFTLSQPK